MRPLVLRLAVLVTIATPASAADPFDRYRAIVDDYQQLFHAAVSHWKPYPKYMLEAMGDLENALENPAQAKAWWTRCVAEADSDTRKSRCQGKLEGL